MKTRLGIAVLSALALAAPATGLGSEIEVYSNTQLNAQNLWRNGQGVATVPLYEFLTLTGRDVEIPGGQISFAVDGWGGVDLSSPPWWNGYNNFQLSAQSASLAGNSGRWSGDLNLAWVRGAFLGNDLRITVGRQSVGTGNARMLQLDGLAVGATIANMITLDAYVGAPTVQRFIGWGSVFSANPTGIDELNELCAAAGTLQIFLDAPETGRPTVATDNQEASLVLARVLLDSIAAEGRAGRVYFVGGMAEHEVTKLRLAGFRAALQERGIRWSTDLFLESLFNAESAYHRVKLLLRTQGDVAALFVNSLLPMDGLVRYVGENAETCRAVHYGVFDYHPMMNLLVDLHVVAIRQNPEQMMQKAYEIFGNPGAHRSERIHYVPYELILTPAMARVLPEPRAGVRTPVKKGVKP